MNTEELLLNRDYTFFHPEGEFSAPRLEVLQGDYKGLIFDLTQSYTIINDDMQKLFFTYKLLKPWNSSLVQDINSMKLTEEEESFVGNLIFNYIVNKGLK
jgi:hypothetical protein